MSHGIDEIIRKINSKTDIPDLSPGGVSYGPILSDVCKGMDMAEVIAPLDELKRMLNGLP